MTRLLAVLVFASLIVSWPAAAAAQPAGTPPAAQDEYVPVTDLPPAEQLPAAPLVIGAYAFIWVAALGYLWIVWRRIAAVERELQGLRRAIETRR